MTVDDDGHWSASVTLSGQGGHDITTVATDAAGNNGTSGAVHYTLDTIAPTVAVTTAAGTVIHAALLVAGTAEAGVNVQLYDGAQAVGSAVTVGSNGQWSVAANLTAGLNSLVAHAVDLAGNTTDSAATQVTYVPAVNLAGGTGNDKLVGREGEDTLSGLGGNDTLLGVAGSDSLDGGAGADSLDGGDDSDTLSGGAGNDTLLGGAGNDTLDGGAGADRLAGGTGNDLYLVDAAGDLVVEDYGAGTDTVLASISYTLTANVENLTLATGFATLGGTGNALANLIIGNAGANTLSGGAGNDTLVGDGGRDTLYGGDGADVFRYGSASEGGDVLRNSSLGDGGDRIMDFVHGVDMLEINAAGFGGGLVAGMDLAASQRFVAGSSANHAYGQFIYYAGNNTLYWDADGTGAGVKLALAIFSTGTTLTASDLHLI